MQIQSLTTLRSALIGLAAAAALLVAVPAARAQQDAPVAPAPYARGYGPMAGGTWGPCPWGGPGYGWRARMMAPGPYSGGYGWHHAPGPGYGPWWR